MKTYLKSDKRRYCEECLSYAKDYKHAHKTFKLSKADIKQMEQENERKTKDLQLKYGTRESDCLNWRIQYSENRRSDFFYNHIECKSCMRWYAQHKRDSLDLNDMKDKNNDLEESSGYNEVFAEPKPFLEDYVHSPYGVFPMNRMCPIHLCNLDADGKCPMCKKGCD